MSQSHFACRNTLIATPISINLRDELINFARQHLTLPKTLIRYRRGDPYDLESLKTGKVWSGAIANLNDPFEAIFTLEGQTALSPLVDELRNHFPNHKPSEEEWNKVFQAIVASYNALPGTFYLTEARRFIGTTSFSTIIDSILMWSHYADMHQGFAVAYDITKTSAATQRGLYPVCYQDTVLDCTPWGAQGASGADDYMPIVAALLTKHTSWSYEREWRLVKFDAQVNTLQDFVQPRAIFLGAKCKSALREQLIEIATAIGAETYKMKLDRFQYRLVPELLLNRTTEKYKNWPT
jgi:hypothetical protein